MCVQRAADDGAADAGDTANGAASKYWRLLGDQQGRCVPREHACVRMWRRGRL